MRANIVITRSSLKRLLAFSEKIDDTAIIISGETKGEGNTLILDTIHLVGGEKIGFFDVDREGEIIKE